MILLTNNMKLSRPQRNAIRVARRGEIIVSQNDSNQLLFMDKRRGKMEKILTARQNEALKKKGIIKTTTRFHFGCRIVELTLLGKIINIYSV